MPAGQGELASDAICTAIMDVPGEVDSLEKLTQWMKENRTMLKNLVATYRATHGKEASSIDMKQFKTLCQKLIHWRQVDNADTDHVAIFEAKLRTGVRYNDMYDIQ